VYVGFIATSTYAPWLIAVRVYAPHIMRTSVVQIALGAIADDRVRFLVLLGKTLWLRSSVPPGEAVVVALVAELWSRN
jgi:hypothetical protein